MNGLSLFIAVFFLLGELAQATPAETQYSAAYDFSAQLKSNEMELAKDPLDLELLFKVADLRLLTQGHAASREILRNFIAQNEFVASRDRVQQAEEKLIATLSRFRLEEAQSTFLRGEIQKENGDRTSALALFTQALRLEPENLVILKEKNLTEFDLELYPAYYTSLTSIFTLLPFQKQWRPQIVEAHFKFKAFPKIVEILEMRSIGRTSREDLALAAAYVETGKSENAISLFRSLVPRLKEPTTLFLAQFYLGKAYTALEHPNLAKIHFLRSQRLARNLPTHRWDPYDLEEKLKELPQWLTKLDLEMPAAEEPKDHGQ